MTTKQKRPIETYFELEYSQERPDGSKWTGTETIATGYIVEKYLARRIAHLKKRHPNCSVRVLLATSESDGVEVPSINDIVI